MLTNNAPEPPAGTALPQHRRGRRRRFAAAALALFLAAFCAATVRLFIFPAPGLSAHVNAIVMLDGRGDRYAEALKLAEQHRAPYLVISLGSSAFGPGGQGGAARCALLVPRVRLICFAPDPATTQGEAEITLAAWPRKGTGTPLSWLSSRRRPHGSGSGSGGASLATSS